MKQHRPSPVNGKAWWQISFSKRFAASFAKDKNNGCWNWIRPNSQGYGGIDFNGKTIPAHRAAWLHLKGPIGDGMCVLHKCDNRRCVNPKHLYLGDKKQNRKDFMERHPRAKQIVDNARASANKATRRFWSSMSKKERANFCKRRSAIQLAKNGGHGANWRGGA